jgi:hypothetical protein
MKGVYTGGCQCGQVRYRLDGEILRLNICHCLDCQKQSGSAFGMSLIVPDATFQLISGELKIFVIDTDSGRQKTCAFCPDCGVRIYNTTTDFKSIKAGTLDETSWLTPDGHYWTKSKQAWTKLPDDVPCYGDTR